LSNTVTIDQKLCINCKACITTCPRTIFQENEAQKPAVNEAISDECIKCGHCMSVCPTDAIAVEGLELSKFLHASKELVSYNDFFTLQANRRSIRQFKPELVKEEVIRKILEATRFAPTAKNTQTLSWTIINVREKIQRIAQEVANTFSKIPAMAELVRSVESGEDQATRNAWQLAVVHGPKSNTWGSIDATLATATFDLAAATLGVGVCWGGFVTTAANKNKEIMSILELEEDQKVFGGLMFGYPNVQYHKVPQRNEIKVKFI
jgi:nitroreductase/ferredoxin